MKQMCLGLLACILLIGTPSSGTMAFDASVPSVDIDLNAKIGPSDLSGHYRTYYRPGDTVMLWAQWRPFRTWKIDLAGRCVAISYVIKNGSEVLSHEESFEVTEMLDWMGYGIGYQIPPTAKAGDVYTFHVAMSVTGVNFVDTYKSAPSSTKLYITDEASSDLAIPYMDEFEQRNWSWSQESLGTCRTTIGKAGGAVTSEAFVFAYFSSYSLWDPGKLNECLTDENAYAPGTGCLLPTDNMGNIALACAPAGVFWIGYFSDRRSNARIRESLERGFPVIAKAVQYGEVRYYVIVGSRGDDRWNVFDPVDGQIHMMESRDLTNSMIRAVYLYGQRPNDVDTVP